MRALLIVAALLGASCGPAPAPACCTLTSVQRDFGYVGTYTSDAGVSTRVQLIISASGEARLSFLREGKQVAQTSGAVRLR